MLGGQNHEGLLKKVNQPKLQRVQNHNKTTKGAGKGIRNIIRQENPRHRPKDKKNRLRDSLFRGNRTKRHCPHVEINEGNKTEGYMGIIRYIDGKGKKKPKDVEIKETE